MLQQSISPCPEALCAVCLFSHFSTGLPPLSSQQLVTRTNFVQWPVPGYCKIEPTGWLKYKVVHVPLWFQNGVWPPSPTGWFQKYKVVHVPLWFQSGVSPPPPLQQSVSKNARWFISQYYFRMGCDLPSSTEWFKNARWFISQYDFRMGCDLPFCNSVDQIKK